MTPSASRDAALPTTDEKAAVVEEMFDRIAPRYDLVNRVMTGGQDEHWRRSTVAALDLPAGSLVLDIACGTGDLCRALDNHHHRPVGIDFSTGMLNVARTSAPLVRADALALPVSTGAVDGVVCGFGLRNFADVRTFFDEAHRALRVGGRALVLETAVPTNAALRAGHAFYFGRVVPLIGGWLSDPTAYHYLPASTDALPGGEVLMSRFEAAGFEQVRRHSMGLGAVQLLVGTRS